MTTGFVSEIFCSNQGEGPLVGQRQVFLRTAGCSATCRWCDTRYSKVRSSHCVIHAQNGDEERTVPNPISAAAAARAVLDAARKDASAVAVSITGGEPLEQVEFVRDIAARCKAGGLDVYLETNGLQAEALAVVLPYVDVIAMDIKLPSATGTVSWKRHESFLACAVSGVATGSHGGAGAGVFVKVGGRGPAHTVRTAAGEQDPDVDENDAGSVAPPFAPAALGALGGRRRPGKRARHSPGAQDPRHPLNRR
jgi:organic radical activating enzyme